MFKNIYEFLKDLIRECLEDRIVVLGAALSFYTILSLAPLLVIIVGVAGFFLGQDTAKQEVIHQAQRFINPDSAALIGRLIDAAMKSSESGFLATIIGSIMFFFTATVVMENLRNALNVIWKSKRKSSNAIFSYIRGKFFSFLAILFVGGLIILTVTGNTVLEALVAYIPEQLPLSGSVIDLLRSLISFGIMSLAFFVIFKVLPDNDIPWKYVLIGSCVTTVLFLFGTSVVSNYLASGAVNSAYEASGTLIVFLLYIYYSSQIFFFGAEFTKIYARWCGKRI